MSNGKNNESLEALLRRKNQEEVTLKRILRRFVRQFLLGWCKGTSLYLASKLFVSLLNNPFQKGSFSRLRQSISVADSIRFGSFFGLYPSIYNITVALLRHFRQKQDGWNFGVAGGIAGLAVVVVNETRRRAIALFVLARALGAGFTTLASRGHFQPLPYGETLLFSFICSFLVLCAARFPKFLSKSYYKSLLKWSRDYTDEILAKLYRQPGESFLTCREVGLHRDSCTEHAVKDFFRSWPTFAEIYLPIHCVPVVIFKRRNFKENPRLVLRSLVLNTARSATFLAAMAMLCKYTMCLTRHVHRLPPPAHSFGPVLGGFACGLSLLVEKANRRKELTLFVIPHALQAVLAMVESTRFARAVRLPYASVVVFALSMAVVMHSYEKEPDSITPLVRGILRFLVGRPQCSVVSERETAT